MAKTDIPRPEHPRPDLRREEWLNLNGQWDFAETDSDESLLNGKFPDKITVPFCRESKLSGLGRTGFVKNVWYRRTFERPKGWKTPRTVFHIGACDWRTTVWINGQKAGEHTGGQSPIDLDVTSLLKAGENTVVVHAFDDTRSGLQALGKQCDQLNSYGCLYTRTTGIWQTVWLEGVGEDYIKQIYTRPMPERSELVINTDSKLQVHAVVKADGKKVAEGDSDPIRSGFIVLPIPNIRLWTPANPFLYDIELTIVKDGKTVDKVYSYTGIRTIDTFGAAITINNRPIFQRLILDQGFYPDGIWTAPSADELKRDIERSMAAGFNGARLHQKVFEPYFLYLADKMGYMVWGEFPNWGLNFNDKRVDGPVIDEWKAIMARDRNHPALVGWCPFNETPQEAIPLQNKIVDITRETDRSRPVIDTSGWSHGYGNPLVMDTHDYDQNPVTFKERYIRYFASVPLPAQYGEPVHTDIPFMVSEYGGIGWDVEGGWGYGNAPKTLDEFYARFKGLSDALLDNPNMFGFCYTQLTDVEQEHNGLYKYDRTPKFDMAKLKGYLKRPAAIEKGTPPIAKPEPTAWSTAVASVKDESPKNWSYTTNTPYKDWQEPAFDDSAWQKGHGGFGAKGGWESSIKTPWTTPDIWLRQSFQWDGANFKEAILAIHYDNDAQVYVNGKLVWQSDKGAWNDRYEGKDVTEALRKAIKQGSNTIAIHCHQDTGGQYIDVGLLLGSNPRP